MLAAVGIVLLMGCISALEIRLMLKKKWKKELWTFLFLMVLATGLAVAQSLNVKIPNPLDYITMIYKPISDWMMKVLK